MWNEGRWNKGACKATLPQKTLMNKTPLTLQPNFLWMLSSCCANPSTSKHGPKSLSYKELFHIIHLQTSWVARETVVTWPMLVSLKKKKAVAVGKNNEAPRVKCLIPARSFHSIRALIQLQKSTNNSFANICKSHTCNTKHESVNIAESC